MSIANPVNPRYIQIAETLRERIQAGGLLPAEKLPPQRKLAASFDTTLMTIRQALGLLEEENLIRTEHGKGSFVVDTRLQEEGFQLLSFSQEMSMHELAIDTYITQVKESTTHEAARQALKLPQGSRVAMLERLRVMEEEPIILQRSFLPPHMKHIVVEYESTNSLYAELRKEADLTAAMAKEIIRPILLTNEQASLMRRRAGTPAYLSYRISFSVNGEPIVYDEAVFSGEKFVIAMERVGQQTKYQLNLLNQKSPKPIAFLLQQE